MPKSVVRLRVDKGQGLRSGILFSTSLVLPPNERSYIYLSIMTVCEHHLQICACLLCTSTMGDEAMAKYNAITCTMVLAPK